MFDRLLSRRDPAHGNDQDHRFGFAIVGLGSIAEYMLDAMADSPSVRASALVSGDASKAAKLAKKYGVPRTLSYDKFDELRDNPDVQAVYLALPVHMHLEYTLRAAAAGKHVLCEKPMSMNSTEAHAMVNACREAGVLLSIAYRCPYDPLHQRAREIVRSGGLGRITRIDSGFGFPLKQNWRQDPALAGGGSLYDVGIYCLNAARYMLGEEPVSATAEAVIAPNGLEQEIVWTSRFPSGAEAHCRSSYLQDVADTITIAGDKGSLRLDPAFSHRSRFRMRGSYTDAGGAKLEIDDQTSRETPSHFRLEAEHLAHCAMTGDTLITPGEDGLADMLAMEAIYRAAGVPVAGQIA